MVLNIRKVLLYSGLVVAVLVAVVICKGFFNRPDVLEQNLPLPPANTLEREISEQIQNQRLNGSFFAQYRMERERVRGQQIEMLKTILNNKDTEKGAREAAALQMMAITAGIEQEMKAENLVKSLGFSDCAYIAQGQTVNVVLNAESIDNGQDKDLRTIVSGLANCPAEKVKITLLKS